MDFEWDSDKNAANIEKHGIDFEEARRIFDSPIRRKVDDRRDYGETRFSAIGVVEGLELHVIYTMRGEVCRIISARRARRDEREEYSQTFGE